MPGSRTPITGAQQLRAIAVDMLVLVTAFLAVPPLAVLYSVLGALILNLFLAINHRADRYLAS